MKSKFLILLLVSLLLVCCDNEQSGGFTALEGPYLGQTPPGMTPEIFAPGIVSTGYSERCPIFTHDGKEFYYALWGAPHGVVLVMKRINNRWTKPVVASFSGQYEGDMTLSGDGKKICFSSNMPLYDNKPGEYYSYYVERTDQGWSKPKNPGSNVNLEESFAGCPTMALSGNLYFFSARSGGVGIDDIYVSKYIDGEYSKAENLGSRINTKYKDLDPFIAPDESYIIFCSDRDGGYGRFDLYISFKNEDGSWGDAINMGEGINSSSSDFCPIVSADGKYLFFTSYRSLYKRTSEKPITYEEKLKILNGPGNGNGDIYWVSSKVIEELRPK